MAAIFSHAATAAAPLPPLTFCDVVKGASYQRQKRFRIMPLTDSLATLTSYSNDVSFDCIFAEQLKNFADNGDVLIAIGGSGNSVKVVNAAEYARSAGCRTIDLTAATEATSAKQLNSIFTSRLSIWVESKTAHLIVRHMMAYELMEAEA